MSRDIQQILLFRNDISPFLVHLTKSTDEMAARKVLEKILRDGALVPGERAVSDVQFAGRANQIPRQEMAALFGATCLTETPLSAIHCPLEIQGPNNNLEPYGLLFIKDRLKKRGVSQVMYINNFGEDMQDVAELLYSLAQTHAEAARKLLPLFSLTGYKFARPGRRRLPGRVDFSWEREWRYPSVRGALAFTIDDIFVGICPHEEIAELEALFEPIRFIDPTRNLKWYADKLIAARERAGISHSVI